MMRQRQRKNVEDLYGSKFDASKSQVTAVQQNSGQKTSRTLEHDSSYIIGSHRPNSPVAVPKSSNSGKETSRRKSARASNKIPNEKQCAKETCANDGLKRSTLNPVKAEKFAAYDKEISNDEAVQAQRHQHSNHRPSHNHRSHAHNEDNDDDTDEFFELIRRTVESAIAKSVPELLSRKFRELSSKVDSFSAELKNTNGLLNQLQHEVGNKIDHYGEENSRHFRYLCMKSEYDKMFYQHQTLVAAAKPPNNDAPTETKMPERRKRSPKTSKSSAKIQRKEVDCTSKNDSCPCLSKNCKTPTVSHELGEDCAPSSENISQKSSEIGMREVLEQIKIFCTQRQFNTGSLRRVPSSDGPGTSHQRSGLMMPDNFIQVNKEVFEDEDDDEWEISSDGMTPRNSSNDPHNKYGGTTSRGGSTQRGNNGSGDG